MTYLITQLAIFITYIPGIYCQLGDYMLPTTNYGNQETTLKIPAVCWPFLPGASGSRHVSLTQSCHGSTWRSTRRDLRNPSAATWSGWFLHQDAPWQTWPSRLEKGGEQVEVGEFPGESFMYQVYLTPAGCSICSIHRILYSLYLQYTSGPRCQSNTNLFTCSG